MFVCIVFVLQLASSRIVAIGAVRGNKMALQMILEHARRSGDSVVVQLGNLLGPGPGDLDVADELGGLLNKATHSVRLMGSNEVSYILGDFSSLNMGAWKVPARVEVLQKYAPGTESGLDLRSLPVIHMTGGLLFSSGFLRQRFVDGVYMDILSQGTEVDDIPYSIVDEIDRRFHKELKDTDLKVHRVLNVDNLDRIQDESTEDGWKDHIFELQTEVSSILKGPNIYSKDMEGFEKYFLSKMGPLRDSVSLQENNEVFCQKLNYVLTRLNLDRMVIGLGSGATFMTSIGRIGSTPEGMGLLCNGRLLIADAGIGYNGAPGYIELLDSGEAIFWRYSFTEKDFIALHRVDAVDRVPSPSGISEMSTLEDSPTPVKRRSYLSKLFTRK